MPGWEGGRAVCFSACVPLFWVGWRGGLVGRGGCGFDSNRRFVGLQQQLKAALKGKVIRCLGNAFKKKQMCCVLRESRGVVDLRCIWVI